MSAPPIVGYVPYVPTARSAEAGWLAEHLSVTVRVAHDDAPSLNDGPQRPLPPLDDCARAVGDLVALPAVVVEGPGGFAWAALLRARGFAGSVTVLPYLNPRRWLDVAAAALYRRFARPADRVFLGSTPSAAIYRSLGLAASVGEPYGIDDRLFGLRRGAERTRRELGIPPGRLVLFAGRAQPDKDVYALLRMSVKARLLFSDLQVVIASHVVDGAYLANARRQLEGCGHVHFVLEPGPAQLADLYNVADAFVTASTSHFETFGRAPAEALACGSVAIAPRYDGFEEVLDQVGGKLVDVRLDARTGAPHVDEELLLRAVYETLSARDRPARREVSAIARRRFGRSRTIRLLGHLNGGAPQPAPVGAADLALPAAWGRALGEIARRSPAGALRWFWTQCDHDRLGAHDDELAAAVRRSLCTPARTSEEPLACR